MRQRVTNIWVAGVLLALLAAASAPLSAQVGRASITGIVTDSTGAVIPGVTVKATHVATGVSYESATNEVGSYTISSLWIKSQNTS